MKKYVLNWAQTHVPMMKIERFKQKYILSENGCWEWQAANNKQGYGSFGYEGRTQLAHRVSYKLFIGEIFEDCMILHSCDNPKCVNPFHLRKGNRSDNMLEMYAKNRNTDRSFENNFNRKLTLKDVEFIRENTDLMQKELASKFGVSRSTILRITSGQLWVKREKILKQ